MPTDQRTVHAVIVNYNSADDLKNCVKSLLIEGVSTVTIVDNASAVEERVKLESIRKMDSRVAVHFEAVNRGFGHGVNAGARLIRAAGDEDLIWIVNPDIVVRPGSLSMLVSALERFDVVSPVILTGDATGEWVWYGGGETDARRGVTTTWSAADLGDEPVAVSFITGAAPMMKLAVWRSVGGFREDLFLYWEDADLGLRMMDRGMALAVVPKATVWHRVGGSGERGGKSPAYYFYMQRNRLFVCGARSSRLGVLIGRGARYTGRLLMAALREPNRRAVKVWASLRGIVAGMLGSYT